MTGKAYTPPIFNPIDWEIELSLLQKYIFTSVISEFWAILCFVQLHKASGVTLGILKIISVCEIEKVKRNMKWEIWNIK